jgi:hypothetical protein
LVQIPFYTHRTKFFLDGPRRLRPSEDKARVKFYAGVVYLEIKSILVVLLIIAAAVIAWELLCFNLGNPSNLC